MTNSLFFKARPLNATGLAFWRHCRQRAARPRTPPRITVTPLSRTSACRSARVYLRFLGGCGGRAMNPLRVLILSCFSTFGAPFATPKVNARSSEFWGVKSHRSFLDQNLPRSEIRPLWYWAHFFHNRSLKTFLFLSNFRAQYQGRESMGIQNRVFC